MGTLVIVTSAHPPFDKRVFHRHARFFAERDFVVELIAPMDDPQIFEDAGVRVHGIRRPETYRERIESLGRIVDLAVRLKGDVYHLHDPELLLIAKRLRRRSGAPVIYDAHEDFPLALAHSRGLRRPWGRLAGASFDVLERLLVRAVDGVVSPHQPRLQELTAGEPSRGVLLPNYPPIGVYGDIDVRERRDRTMIYTGLLSRERGALMILEAAARMPDVHFLLLAEFADDEEQTWFAETLKERSLPNIDFRGFVPFAEVVDFLAAAAIGIMPWEPTAQHLRAAQPSKLYEYMAASLPVLASDLPITRRVVSETESGLLHEWDDVDGFVAAAYRILDDPELARTLGLHGRRAFEEQFSYERAAGELAELYGRLLT